MRLTMARTKRWSVYVGFFVPWPMMSFLIVTRELSCRSSRPPSRACGCSSLCVISGGSVLVAVPLLCPRPRCLLLLRLSSAHFARLPSAPLLRSHFHPRKLFTHVTGQEFTFRKVKATYLCNLLNDFLSILRAGSKFHMSSRHDSLSSSALSPKSTCWDHLVSKYQK
jgi:hypothetical protein